MASKHSKKHDQMVEYVTRHLKQRFYDDIRARVDGFHPPLKVADGNGAQPVVPDVTMVARGTRLNVLEVETPETLRRAETPEKWKALARHAEANGGQFWVVVPRGTSASAVQRLRTAAVDARVWEVEPEGT